MTLKNVGKSENDSAEHLQGTLTSLEFMYPISIRRVSDELDNGTPTHDIWLRPPNREFMLAGRAWQKTIQRGPNTGQTLISCTLDEPSFGDKYRYFTLFEDSPGEWTIRWSRPRQDAE